MRKHQTEFADISTAIGQHLTRAISALSAIRDRAETHLSGIVNNRAAHREDLIALRHTLQAALAECDGTVDGIGIAALEDFLTDSRLWIEWWRFDQARSLEFVTHSLNPSRDVFYDYSDLDWFARPLRSHRTTVTGPFVDFGGTNTSTVTVGMPVFVKGECVAIAGADIHTERFEQYLLTAFVSTAPVPDEPDESHSNSEFSTIRPSILLNADNRVITSNTAAHLTGDLIDDSEITGWESTAIHLGRSVDIGWRLIAEAPGSRP